MKFREFDELRETKMSKKEAMDKLGIHRYCCRRMMVGLQEGLVEIVTSHSSTGFVNTFTRLHLGLDAVSPAVDGGCASIQRTIIL